MKVKIKNLSDLLSEKISLTERGLMITIVLLKDSDPKLTLAKVRVKVKMKDVCDQLIKLHELQFIEWSGYKKALKAKAEQAMAPEVIEIVDFMNDLWRRDFQPDSKSTTTGLIQRMQDHSVDDIKLVIANRYSEWKDDPVMHKYLSPTTIFRPSKFDKYLEEAKRTKTGESLVNARNIDLKKGDEITIEIAKELTDDDVYVIRVFTVVKKVRVGTGRIEKLIGKRLRGIVKSRANNIAAGREIDSDYCYEGK